MNKNFFDRKVSFYKTYRSFPSFKTTLRKMLFPEKPLWAETVTKLRNTSDVSEYKRLKHSLPCFVPAGIHVKNGAIPSEWSGLLCLDIDDHDGTGKLPDIKKICEELPFVAYCGLSCGGLGYFLLIPISTPEHYELHYNSIKKFFKDNYGLETDDNCRTPSKLRHVSIDECPYVNENAKVYCHQLRLVGNDGSKPHWESIRGLCEHPYTSKKTGNHKGHISNLNDDAKTELEVLRLILQVLYEEVDITSSYNNWQNVCFSLLSVFGDESERARQAFHLMSKFYPSYSFEECDKKFEDFAKGYRGDVKAGTLFHLYYAAVNQPMPIQNYYSDLDFAELVK